MKQSKKKKKQDDSAVAEAADVLVNSGEDVVEIVEGAETAEAPETIEVSAPVEAEPGETAESAESVAGAEVAAEETLDSGPMETIQELEYAPAPKGRAAASDPDEKLLELANIADARAVLEAYLFASNEPLAVNRLSKLMNNLQPRVVRGLLLELQMEYDNRAGGLQIVEIAGGFQMCTRPHLADWMFRMHKHRRRSALSPATLETLAIVAYKQPITSGEVEIIRGVDSGGTLRTLQDLNLIEVSGRREVLGRPQLYSTTLQFLKTFGLKSLADLPSIHELKNLFAEDQKLKAAVAEPVEAARAEQPEEASQPSAEEAPIEAPDEASVAPETPAEDAPVVDETAPTEDSTQVES